MSLLSILIEVMVIAPYLVSGRYWHQDASWVGLTTTISNIYRSTVFLCTLTIGLRQPLRHNRNLNLK